MHKWETCFVIAVCGLSEYQSGLRISFNNDLLYYSISKGLKVLKIAGIILQVFTIYENNFKITKKEGFL